MFSALYCCKLRTVNYVLTRCSPIDVSNRLLLTFFYCCCFCCGKRVRWESTESYIVGLDEMAMVCLSALHKTNAWIWISFKKDKCSQIDMLLPPIGHSILTTNKPIYANHIILRAQQQIIFIQLGLTQPYRIVSDQMQDW